MVKSPAGVWPVDETTGLTALASEPVKDVKSASYFSITSRLCRPGHHQGHGCHRYKKTSPRHELSPYLALLAKAPLPPSLVSVLPPPASHPIGNTAWATDGAIHFTPAERFATYIPFTRSRQRFACASANANTPFPQALTVVGGVPTNRGSHSGPTRIGRPAQTRHNTASVYLGGP